MEHPKDSSPTDRYKRRQFLTRSAAVGAVGVSLPAILAACGGSSRAGSTAASSTTAAVAKKGGTLVFGVDALTGTFDPALFSTFADWMSVDMISRGLTRTDFGTAKVMPELASSWDVSSDGRTYMFTIRDNATFHDGSPVTAKDFERTWQRMFNPNDPTVAPGGYGALLLGAPNTHSFKALPDGRFQVNLVRADVSFPAKAGVQAGAVLSAAQIEKDGKKVGEKPIGAGPFKLGTFTEGQNATFEAYPGFWAGAPLLDKIIFQVISDPTALATAVQTGSVQASVFVPLSSLNSMGSKVVVQQGKPYVSHFAFLNVSAPALQDKRVRDAINLALDRSAITKSGFSGYAQEPAYVIPPPDIGYEKSLKSLSTQDVAKAKSLVKEAGAEGRQIKIVSSNARWWPAVGQIIEQNLNAVGLKATVEYLDQSAFLAKTSDPKQHEIAIDTYAAILADPDDAAYSIFKSDQFYAAAITATDTLKGPSKTIDQLVAQGREETDPTARGQIYVNMQKTAAAEMAGIAMLAQNAAPVAHATNVVGIDLDGLGTYRMFPEKLGLA